MLRKGCQRERQRDLRGCIGGTLRNSTALFQARVCERDSDCERDDGKTQSKQTFFSLDYA